MVVVILDGVYSAAFSMVEGRDVGFGGREMGGAGGRWNVGGCESLGKSGGERWSVGGGVRLRRGLWLLGLGCSAHGGLGDLGAIPIYNAFRVF